MSKRSMALFHSVPVFSKGLFGQLLFWTTISIAYGLPGCNRQYHLCEGLCQKKLVLAAGSVPFSIFLSSRPFRLFFSFILLATVFLPCLLTLLPIPPLPSSSISLSFYFTRHCLPTFSPSPPWRPSFPSRSLSSSSTSPLSSRAASDVDGISEVLTNNGVCVITGVYSKKLIAEVHSPS
jgi:hypothetical protein